MDHRPYYQHKYTWLYEAALSTWHFGHRHLYMDWYIFDLHKTDYWGNQSSIHIVDDNKAEFQQCQANMHIVHCY